MPSHAPRVLVTAQAKTTSHMVTTIINKLGRVKSMGVARTYQVIRTDKHPFLIFVLKRMLGLLATPDRWDVWKLCKVPSVRVLYKSLRGEEPLTAAYDVNIAIIISTNNGSASIDVFNAWCYLSFSWLIPLPLRKTKSVGWFVYHNSYTRSIFDFWNWTVLLEPQA